MTVPRDVERRMVSMLAKGAKPEMVARRLARPAEEVVEVAQRHGWPDLGRLLNASVQLANPTDPDAAADLVAVASGDPELAPLADAAAKAIAALSDAMAARERRSQLRDELAQLELEIAERQKRADDLRAKLTPLPAVVRAWAANQGIDCPKTGRMPRRVIVAYENATRR